MAHEIKFENKPFPSRWSVSILQRNFLWVLLIPFSMLLMAFILGPIPPSFMLNHEKKQCSMMYGGGEGFQYEAPEPWQAAKPDKSGMIYTEFGSCNVYDVYGLRSSAEDCCQKLGYTYINTIPGIVEKKDYGVIITMNSIIFLSFCIFWSPILLIIGLSVWAIYLLIKKYIPNKQRNIGA